MHDERASKRRCEEELDRMEEEAERLKDEVQKANIKKDAMVSS